jgi:hypothetical protein
MITDNRRLLFQQTCPSQHKFEIAVPFKMLTDGTKAGG